MVDRLKLLPVSAKDLEITVVSRYRISVGHLLLIGCSFTNALTIFTILKTVVVDYERSTFTHCNVLHIVPSMSAVIHANQSCWKLLTWSHLPVRLLIAWLYWRYQRRILPRRTGLLIYLFIMFFILNNISSIAIAEFGDVTGVNMIHVVPALSSWVTSCGFMAISFYCFTGFVHKEPRERLSYVLKRKLLLSCLSASVVLWPLYFLHTELCVPLGTCQLF